VNKEYTMLFIVVFCIGLLCAGGTYAYWTWTSNVNKNVVFNTSKEIAQYVIYDEGDSYFIGDFQPASNYCGGISNTISFYKSTGDAELVDLMATIYMDVNAIENNIAASDDVYWVITSGNAASCTGNLSDAVNYGTFKGKSDGSVITMLENLTVTTTAQQFTTWIWIDEDGSNLSALSGETVDTNIWTQIDMLDAGE